MGLHANEQKRINLGHQEVERLIEELEAVYAQLPKEETSGWLQVNPTARFLCMSLGYEDRAEFEDALNGTFLEFLQALPSVQTRKTARDAQPSAEQTNKKARTGEAPEGAHSRTTQLADSGSDELHDWDNESAREQWEFRILPELPASEWRGRQLRLRVAQVSQLWNVLLKSAHASILIPHMDFSIEADGRKKVAFMCVFF